jgi:tetratricopeptide (TPR) repeat protein
LGRALRAGRRYEDAIEAYKKVGSPRYQHCAEMAACYAALGNDHEAAKQTAETLRLNPGFSTEIYVASLSYRNTDDREHLRDSLRKAGLPA